MDREELRQVVCRRKMRELEDVYVERNLVKDSEECTSFADLFGGWKLCALWLEMNMRSCAHM